MNMALRGAAVLIAAAMATAGCHSSATTTPTTGDPGAATTSPPAPAVQIAAFDTTLTITDRDATAAYTVANLRPVPLEAQIIPARGTMFAVDVTIAAQSGTVTYNGFYFVAKTFDGSNIPPAVGAVKPGITSGELAEGQNIDGHVAFDVPVAQSITQVVLRDPKGRTIAVWGSG